jgi:hypothetical protein
MFKFILFLLTFVLFNPIYSGNISGYKKNILKEQNFYKKNHIKKVTLFLGDSIFNQEYSKILKTRYYDNEGRLTLDSLYEFAEDESIPFTKYYYDSDGNMMYYEEYGSDIVLYTHNFVYSEDGKAEGSSLYSGEPRRIVYNYDTKGYLTSTVGFTYYYSAEDTTGNTPWVEIEKVDFKYNNDFNVIEHKHYRRGFNESDTLSLFWEIDSKIVKKYDKKKRLIKEEYYNAENNNISNNFYYYNKEGLIKSTVLKLEKSENSYYYYIYEFYDK